jgi:hypothetical protein
MKTKQREIAISKIKEIVKRIDGIESFERYDWNGKQKHLDFPDYIRASWILKDTNFACCNWMGKIHWEDLNTEDLISFEEVFESCPDNIKEDLVFNMDIFNASNSKNFYGFVQR